MRELTPEETNMIGGAGLPTCYPPPPPPPPPIPILGNPGNFKPVGKAGEAPNGDATFVFGGTFVPVLNGQKGMSSG